MVAGSRGMPIVWGRKPWGRLFGRTSALVVPDASADKGRQMVAVQGQGIDVFVKPRCRLLEKPVSFKKGEEQGPL
jgi:hypothetical protein